MFRWDQPFVLDDRSIGRRNVHTSDHNPTPDDHPSAYSDNVDTSDDNPTPDNCSSAGDDVTPPGCRGLQLHTAE
jgi:hypothetical protein